MLPVPPVTFGTPHIEREDTVDGRVLLRSRDELAAHAVSVVHDFRAHAEAHPDRLAQGLLDQELARRPIMVLSGNSRLHLTVALAAMTLGVPVVPTSVPYSLQSTDHAKLRAMVALVDPGLVVAEDAAFAPAVAAVVGAGSGRSVLSGHDGVPGALTLDDLLAQPTPSVDERCAALRADTVAKILFTSGSTGAPKGVLNTHGMLAANQQQLRQVWPFVTEEPPVLLDWLPWSHTFGGNHDTNLVLTSGGTLFVDDGRPSPAAIGRTVAHLTEVRPTVYFNVPAGWAALVPRLERR